MKNQDFYNVKKSLDIIGKMSAVMTLFFVFSGLIPSYAGSAFMINGALARLLGYYMNIPDFYFFHIGYAVSPIWILYFDPCALPLAQTYGVANFMMMAVEYRNTKTRLFYLLLTVVSWIVVWLTRGALFDECTVSVDSNFIRNTVLFLMYGIFSVFAASNQVDSRLKATKEALAQVKELNTKNEALNAELKQLLDDKDNFILLFSHETRNPLNILIGNLTLLLDEAETPQAKNRIIRCKFCADLLLQHLNNILDSGKLANNRNLEITPTPLRPQEYFLSITSFMDMLVRKKKALTPVFYIPQNLPKVLKFDTQRLTQIVLNLLTNAVKFTNAGEISLVVRYMKKETLQESDYYPTTGLGYRLLNSEEETNASSLSEFPENPIGSDIQLCTQFRREIHSLEEKRSDSAERLDSQKGFLKLEITDTGCGMKEEELLKLFKKFSQTHAEGSQRQIGSGLGLWITKTLCELMGGGIKVFSKPNIGTCFTAIIQADQVRIPRPRPKDSPRKLKVNVNKATDTARRILVADDDPFNLEFHLQIIKEFGYTVIETAYDGQNLIDLFMEKPEGYYETIITDISMPRVDGIQAASMIRELEKQQNRSRKVRIGFITGHPNLKDKEQCEKEPIAALFYLSKPIKASMLEGFLRYKGAALDQILSPLSACSGMNILQAKPLVLCIDDDDFNLGCLGDMLESLGAKVVKARSGEEGLQHLNSVVFNEGRTINLVLLDCRMSGMDGWETSLQIKNLLRILEKPLIPVIGLTGEYKEMNIENFRNSKMDDIIQKPISRDTLQELLRKYS